MRDVVIVDAVRTPIGRYGGALRDMRPDDLAAVVISALIRRTGVDPGRVDDVILGCANQAGEDGRNVARMALLQAGLPAEVPGQTVNRLCGSGLQAVVSAFHAIRCGEGDVVIAGGVESMTRAPFVVAKSQEPWSRRFEVYDTTLGPRFSNPRLVEKWPGVAMALGETAEIVAERYGITREEQDRYALESQRRAARAIAEGRFRDELVPVVVAGKGEPVVVEQDEHPRPDVTLDRLAALRPAFRREGTVTAGNSSGLNDGAAALMLMDAHTCAELHLRPLARILASAVAGVDPAVMGLGPVPAVRKALWRAGLRLEDIDLVELNEAFAAQVLACVRELGLDLGRVNPNGGAIALGHPLGASGARILTTLVWELHRRQARYGLATMCIGVGQGIAVIVERVDGV
ncbi:MAG: thiolase family protein [Armatimonadota bacterium]|nr:thiolase family protein [Armatimonadota bacterium]MDR7440313.1 thiolase family protein [Armatimonadota bacterium]MDR7562768.1 thiolase family protein [Armatimonadota bacterium]MDR7568651.1 thiolase family protein [Armatimonadota bacterium]MDR7600919.1 thiolase family protein [Armatimonadota bacterium]